MQSVILLSGDPWEMTDDRTGEIRRGVSFWFVNSYRDSDRGLKPTKISGPPQLFETVRGRLPCVCVLSYGMRPGAQNKATLQLDDIEVIAPFNLESAVEQAQAA